MECPYCSAANRDGTRYCGSCGRFIGSNQAPPGSTTTADTVVSTNPTNPSGASGSYRSIAPGTRLQGGRYLVKSILGQGGMGAALLATDLRLDDKQVVIKELISDSIDPTKLQEDVRNFKREVSLVAHIDHPLVPNVTDHFQEGTRYFMVQEYIDGENLEARLDRTNQPMMEREALICASEILDILEYLAQQTPPIVHRDIKPANIIVGTRDKRAHLVDFGIARADIINARRKQTSALGTPGYAPPEQYQGNADPRSDVYGLAATLHHLLTNRDPRNHAPFNFPAVRALNPQISPETERVLTRALNNDINQRYQSASLMKQEVDSILRQRFGLSGNIDSYTLSPSGGSGTSGPMPTLPASDPTMVASPYPSSVTPVQPLTPIAPPPPPPGYAGGYPSQPSQPMSPIPSTPIAGGYSMSGAPGVYPNTGGIGSGPTTYTPGYLPQQPPTQTPPRRRRTGLVVLVVLLLLALIGGGTFVGLRLLQHGPDIGVGVETIGGEKIGISDGSYVFDTTRENSSAKQQAAQQMLSLQGKTNADYDPVISDLNEAVRTNTNDAEALIYKANAEVLKSGKPYVTFVVATMLTGSNSGLIGTGRDDLQGAYVAQKEYNDGAKLNNQVLVRLLIANSGSDDANVDKVVQRIVHLAQVDKTFVGVLGWPHSGQTKAAYKALADAHIPLLSQTASDDGLTGASPYFFRVAPPNKQQAIEGAKYAKQNLKANKIALFYDPKNAYSNSLAQGFKEAFQALGGQIVVEETYTVHNSGNMTSQVQDALSKNPDLFYFSGYSDDVNHVLANTLPQGLRVLGGDALYELGGYSSGSQGFSRLNFTAFSYPDEWEAQHLTNQKPVFFSHYSAYFDPGKQQKAGTYGFNRPNNDVILSYDGMLALLSGTNIALSGSKTSITSVELRDGLSKVNGSNSFQGVSGQISFDNQGNPVDKAIVILRVSSEGFIQMDHVQGKFLVGA